MMIFYLAIWTGLTGCVKSTDPQDSSTPYHLISIAELKSRYVNGQPRVLVEDIVIEGWIRSRDDTKNFTYSMIIEDNSGGIEIKVGKIRYSNIYYRTQKVRIRCSGLVLGSYGGAVQLGWISNDPNIECSLIPEKELPMHISVVETSDPVPDETTLTISDISPRYINCYVRFFNVQFTDAELGLTFGHPEDYTDRHLCECGTGRTLAVRTAPTANFTHVRLPEKNGQFPGILRYFHGTYYLQINSDIYSFENPRCHEK